jgi:hypothetical protein
MIDRIVNSPASKPPKSNISSGNLTRQKLEKHIKDHSSGEGHLSREMYGKIRKHLNQNSEILKGTDASIMYAAYTTLYSTYEKKARMATSLNYSLQQTRKITNTDDNDQQD